MVKNTLSLLIGKKLNITETSDGNISIYYNDDFVVCHPITNKKFNYKIGHMHEILKSDACRHLSSTEIDQFIKENISMMDIFLGELYISGIDDADIFKFSAYSGDRLAVRLNGIEVGNDFDLYLLNSNFEVIDRSERASNANEIVRLDVPSAGNYYILVLPLSTDGYANDVYYLSFYNRIKTGSYTATLSPTSISRQGSGTLSSTATVNLTNNSSIPAGAIVRSVQAQGTISPNLGNTFRQVLNAAENVWHTSNQGGTSFTDLSRISLISWFS